MCGKIIEELKKEKPVEIACYAGIGEKVSVKAVQQAAASCSKQCTVQVNSNQHLALAP